MYLKYLKFLYLCTVLGLLVSPISAQENIINNLLNSNQLGLNLPKRTLLELPQILNRNNKDFILPNAKGSETQNLKNLKEEKENEEINETDQLQISNIERYYGLLTPHTLPIFGHKSFSTIESEHLLFFNTVGREYQLAPGDVLKVTIRGLTPIDTTTQISQYGNIILPGLRPLNVEGLKLNQVEEKIFDLVKFDDSSAFVNITLEAARLIPVQITGAARHPQTIAVPAYTPLSRILPKFGGIQKDGSFRNIVLTDSKGTNKKIDLYDLLRGENNFEDPLLTNATRIHIKDIGLTVAATGFVGRPGIFELPENIKKINAEALLELANAKMLPPGATLEILRINSNGVVEKQTIQSIENLTIYAGEILNIELPQTIHTNRIVVQGAVLKAYEVTSKNDNSLAEILKYGATLMDNALLDFAIIKPRATTQNLLRTVDLRHAFDHPDKVMVSPGESVIVLNSMLYKLILDHAKNNYSMENTEMIPLKSDQEFLKDIIEFIEVKKVAQKSQKIYIDDVVVALAPDLPKDSLLDTIKERVNLPRNLNLDFAFKVENFGKPNKKLISFSPKDIFNNNETNVVFLSENSHSNVKLFSNQYLISLLTTNIDNSSKSKQNFIVKNQSNQIGKNSLDEVKQTEFENKTYALAKDEVQETRPTMIYIDDKLNHIVSKNIPFQKSVGFKSIESDPKIYPFVVRTEKLKTSNDIVVPSPHYSSLAGLIEENRSLSKIELFTSEFIRNLLNDNQMDVTDIFENDDQGHTRVNKIGVDRFNINQLGMNELGMNELGISQIQENDTNDDREQTNPIETEFKYLKPLKRISKLVSGALEKPGFYPVIGEVSLDDLISIAGGLLPGADLKNITLIEYGNIEGATDVVETKFVDITSIHPKRVILDGHFTVYVPYLANNANVGSIEVKGEVLHPGKYSFSRDETLEEILIRAGGFTETAYPLGASFHRESLKNEQKISNENLAREVEQSILFLSQSQLSGAGDQIKAVIAYANQLKNMPASGKQTLDIEGSSKKMLLQNGDELFIPKRPSHVTISGSVQNPVTTTYNPDKSMDHYISDAGGFKRIADKKNIFILLPNGKNITLSSLRNEGTRIPAGSIIVVPPKTDKLSALGLTDIWSRVLGNIATSILAINAATR